MIAQTTVVERPARREVVLVNTRTGATKTEHYAWSTPLSAIYATVREVMPDWAFLSVAR